MPAFGRRCRLSTATATVSIVLAGWTPAVAAQGGSGPVVSAVAQVHLVTVVLPGVVPAALTRPTAIAWNTAAGTGVASVTLSTNTPYRLVVHRVERGWGGAPASRIWVQADGSEREVTIAEPVVVRRGRSAEGSILVPFRMRTERGESEWAGGPPLRFDVVVDPTL